jgi:hypothetical protein
MISVCCENQMKPISILWPEDSCLTLKEIVNIVTALLSRVMNHAEIKHQLFTEPSQFNEK